MRKRWVIETFGPDGEILVRDGPWRRGFARMVAKKTRQMLTSSGLAQVPVRIRKLEKGEY